MDSERRRNNGRFSIKKMCYSIASFLDTRVNDTTQKHANVNEQQRKHDQERRDGIGLR